MKKSENYYVQRANSIPLDPTLLESLGKVQWAAIRLHHAVRDTINKIESRPQDTALDITLGQCIAELKKEAKKLSAHDQKRIEEWCENLGIMARNERNSVTHALAATIDGEQALIRDKRSDDPYKRLSIKDLEVVAGILDDAFLELTIARCTFY